MTKQRARKRVQTNHTQLDQPSLMMWVVAFLLVGGIVIGLYYLHTVNLKTSAERLLTPLVSPLTENKTAVKFEYYNHAPVDTEFVPVVKPATKTIATTITPKPAPVNDAKPIHTATGKRYSLQVASFHQLTDAQKSKEQLTAAGFPATVEKAKVNGTDWYRVMVGPYANLQATQAAQEQLTAKHMRALLVGT